MPRPEYPVVNGADTSWADLSLIFTLYATQGSQGASFRTPDFSALKAKETVDPGEKRGQGSIARGRTVGTYKAEASVSFFLAAFLAFKVKINTIAKQLGVPPTLVTFDISGYFKTPGQPKQSIQVVAASIVENGVDLSPSNDAIAVEVPLWTPRVRFNGSSLIEVPT